MMTRRLLFNVVVLLVTFSLFSSQTVHTAETPVRKEHLDKINEQFKSNGIRNGFVELDRYGRVKLRGKYESEKEVAEAFSYAQVIVGSLWVSPVTPDNIKNEQWTNDITNGLKQFAKNQVQKENQVSPKGVVPPAKNTAKVINKYALLIGIGKFINASPKSNLMYAASDAKQFYNYLVNPNEGGFLKENVIILLDEQATYANISAAIGKIKDRAKEDDMVVLFASSHGTPPNQYGAMHLVTYDTIFEPRHAVWETSFNEKMIKSFGYQIKSKNVIMILDACFSNNAYKDIPGFLPTGGKSLGIEDSEKEGMSISKDYAKRLVGAKDIVLEGTNDQVNVVNDDATRVLISSSSESQKSWESDELKSGIFTYYFLEGLRSNGGQIKDAFNYANPKVRQRVQEEKFAYQYPDIHTNKTESYNIKISK
ncbi:MAG: caspase family protein [Nitrospirota bacterium]